MYITLSAVGLVTAWTFNGIAVMNGEDYGAAWTGSAVDWVLTADLSIVAIAAVVFMFAEAHRLGLKRVWIYVLLSGFTAMAFTFPLFLAMRERAIAGRDK
ncbi:MAG: hypothetical protein RLZZ40_34 [Actinomycetota bacterium]